MRARNIKPGFFTNEELANCSPLARILFVGLWCMADKAGRLEDRPKRIKASILPYDTADVDALLNELESEAGVILRYKVNGRKCIQVINFVKHQNPHHREADSGIPAPPETTEAEPSFSEAEPCLGNPASRPLRADSGFLIPDSGFSESPIAGEGGEKREDVDLDKTFHEASLLPDPPPPDSGPVIRRVTGPTPQGLKANLDPSGLAWNFRTSVRDREPNSQESLGRIAADFKALIDRGIEPQAILDRIRGERNKSQPIWEFIREFFPPPRASPAASSRNLTREQRKEFLSGRGRS